MNDTTLYQQILGDTKPWTVSEVQLDMKEQTVEVRLMLPPKTNWACPECRRRMHVKDWRTRRWRHLDSCQFQTILVASVPVVECAEHGAQTVQVPWAEGSSRFTMLFERFAVEVLIACSASKAGELLGITWEQADGIKQRAVLRGLARRQLGDLESVCVDEKAVGRGHDYVTIVTGMMDGKPQVLHVEDGKDEEAFNRFWEWLGPEGCERIKAVSMDMSLAYQASTRRYCPDAELIFDPFHVMKMINKAVDEVRRMEMVSGTKQDRTKLKDSRQLWLYGEENVPTRHADRFNSLKASTLRTARAWRTKELWRTFKHCVDWADGMAFLKSWLKVAMRSKLEPIKKVAQTMKDHAVGIVNVLKYGFSNATAEGINSQIQLLKQKSCGYRNRERLKTDILFHFGGLNMAPCSVQ